MPEKMLAAVCAVWTLGILLKQFQPHHRVWRRFDVLWIFPSYRYFAPIPDFHDYFLQYRLLQQPGQDVEQREEELPWLPMTLYPPRTWIAAFWNPDRLRIHLLERQMETLLERTRQGRQVDMRSHAFNDLLRFITPYAEQAGAASFQFRILIHAPRRIAEIPSVGFQSKWQPLP